MRIGVISDTHVKCLDDLPAKALDILSGMDMVIHLGDYTGKTLLEELRKNFNFKGVCGNMDPHQIKKELPKKDVFEVKGFKIGITHPAEGGFPFFLEKRLKAKFGRDVPIILYGHTHRAVCRFTGEILYLNPGSLTKVFPATYCSLGVLTINNRIDGKILKF